MIEEAKVAAIQCSCEGVEGKENNVKKIINLIKEHGKKYDLLVFPELIIQGYVREVTDQFTKEYSEAAETIPGSTTNRLAEITEELGSHVVFGIAEKDETTGALYNTSVLIGPDGYIGKSRKMHLALLEKNYFTPGEGSEVYPTKLGNIGLVVCYDLFFPESSRIAAIKGAEILVHIAAAMGGGKDGGVGKAEDKKRFFESAQVTRAIENQVHYVGTDMVGSCYMGENYGTWKPMGLSKIIDNYGKVLSKSELGTENVISATLTQERLLEGRSVYPLLSDRMPENYEDILKKA